MQIVNTLEYSRNTKYDYSFTDYIVFIPSVGKLVFTIYYNGKYGKEWSKRPISYHFKGTPIKLGTSHANNFKQNTCT